MPFRKIQETVRPFEYVSRTTCGNCPAGCGLKVFFKDGKPVDFFGDEEHPVNKGSLCPKGLLTYFHVSHPDRLKKPGIREDLEKPFKTVSWKEAVEFTAEKLEKFFKENGADSVAIFGSEADPFDYTAAGDLFARRFKAPLGPSRFFPHAFGPEGAAGRMFGVSAAELLTNSPRDWCNSRCILLYCCDLAVSAPISFGPVLDARDRGTTLLSIGLKESITSSKAAMSIRVKPGSQSALLGGIINLLITKGYVDHDFIAGWTEGFDLLKAEVGKFSPETVSKICEVEAQQLEQFVDLLGRTGPVQVIAGDRSSRRFLTDADLCGCAAVACLRGSIGVPGGGVNFLGASPFFSGNEGGNESRGGRVSLERVLAAGRPPLTSLFWYGNPYTRLTGGREIRAALRNIPLVAHLSCYPNETYRQSHVSIPVSSLLEYEGIVHSGNGRAIQAHKKLIDPPGECHSPLEFWSDLASALGAPDCFDLEGAGDSTDRNGLFCDVLLERNPLTSALSSACLDPNRNLPGGVMWPCSNSAQLRLEATRFVQGTVRGENILFQRNRTYIASGRRFPTASGKIIFQSLPENKSESEDPDYPLMLTAGPVVDHVEQFGGIVSDRRSGAGSFITINPRLAEVIGAKEGESLTLENSRGRLCASTHLSDEVAAGVVWVPEGASSGEPGQCEGPMSLFSVPGQGCSPASFTMVTAYRTEADRDVSREKILRFLEARD